jgi:cytochrome oxidase Cu insertion factor (SCO1/SenC/PrrC family)
MTGGLGVFLVVMAALQAWPGRGFWTGASHGRLGTLAAMPAAMSLTPQPAMLAQWVSAFAAFDVAHGFAVNLFVVVVLAAAGAAFLTGLARLAGPALAMLAVVALATWVLVQDLGFLGGLGTDPNSMIPFLLLAAAAYLALTRHTAGAEAPSTPPPVPARASLPERIGAASAWSAAALGGACLVVLGAVPLAAAQANRNADPILAESIARPVAPVSIAAPAFTLTSQYGSTVTLASLRGKIVLLSFIDPGCTTGCPPVEAEFRRTAALLGPSARQVEFVAIVAGAAHRSLRDVRSFDARAGLCLPAPAAPSAHTCPRTAPRRVADWLFLTGSGGSLRQVWRAYQAALPAGRAGGEVFLIDRQGRIRQEYLAGRGPVTAATTSSFAVLFTDAARRALGTRLSAARQRLSR